MWKVYDKTGTKVRCEVRKVQYSGTFMGECFVNTTIYSELPIDFEIEITSFTVMNNSQ